MSTFIGRTEIRRSEVLASIGQELGIKQEVGEAFGNFARRIRAKAGDEDAQTKLADKHLAKWITRDRNDVGPTHPLRKQQPRVEKVLIPDKDIAVGSGEGGLTELFDFVAWLTTLEPAVTIGASEDSGIGVELIRQFREVKTKQAEEAGLGGEDSSASSDTLSTTPYSEGVIAGKTAVEEQLLVENPYEEGTLNYTEWDRGYEEVVTCETPLPEGSS